VIADDDIGPWKLVELEVSIAKGREGEVPRWLLNVTKSVKPIQRLTLQELNRILFQETQSTGKPASLMPVGKDFYAKVKDFIAESREQEVYKKVQSAVRELVTVRLRKIMTLAFLGVQDPTILQNMADEELLLFSEMRELITSYYGELIGEHG